MDICNHETSLLDAEASSSESPNILFSKKADSDIITTEEWLESSFLSNLDCLVEPLPGETYRFYKTQRPIVARLRFIKYPCAVFNPGRGVCTDEFSIVVDLRDGNDTPNTFNFFDTVEEGEEKSVDIFDRNNIKITDISVAVYGSYTTQTDNKKRKRKTLKSEPEDLSSSPNANIDRLEYDRVIDSSIVTVKNIKFSSNHLTPVYLKFVVTISADIGSGSKESLYLSIYSRRFYVTTNRQELSTVLGSYIKQWVFEDYTKNTVAVKNEFKSVSATRAASSNCDDVNVDDPLLKTDNSNETSLIPLFARHVSFVRLFNYLQLAYLLLRKKNTSSIRFIHPQEIVSWLLNCSDYKIKNDISKLITYGTVSIDLYECWIPYFTSLLYKLQKTTHDREFQTLWHAGYIGFRGVIYQRNSATSIVLEVADSPMPSRPDQASTTDDGIFMLVISTDVSGSVDLELCLEKRSIGNDSIDCKILFDNEALNLEYFFQFSKRCGSCTSISNVSAAVQCLVTSDLHDKKISTLTSTLPKVIKPDCV